jgi:hypothetical protein
LLCKKLTVIESSKTQGVSNANPDKKAIKRLTTDLFVADLGAATTPFLV